MYQIETGHFDPSGNSSVKLVDAVFSAAMIDNNCLVVHLHRGTSRDHSFGSTIRRQQDQRLFRKTDLSTETRSSRCPRSFFTASDLHRVSAMHAGLRRSMESKSKRPFLFSPGLAAALDIRFAMQKDNRRRCRSKPARGLETTLAGVFSFLPDRFSKL